MSGEPTQENMEDMEEGDHREPAGSDLITQLAQQMASLLQAGSTSEHDALRDFEEAVMGLQEAASPDAQKIIAAWQRPAKLEVIDQLRLNAPHFQGLPGKTPAQFREQK